MDWNHDGKIDGSDYVCYKAMTESSGKSSGNNSSQTNTTSDGSLKFLLIVIIVSVVYAVLEAMGSN